MLDINAVIRSFNVTGTAANIFFAMKESARNKDRYFCDFSTGLFRRQLTGSF
jgi:hypothetical protein